ncbi:SusC/RagA family TonB-linked outer membrane protein [Chitinophaga sp. 22321]|uniref:SusC/RagA family TonB-linked outer membrane protein n=1 Tax=Chitinophaga hostae TaxID=2831022 RepID=A0ABS5J7D8_9BACT|nr:SusC/RagA family TonB-linked outer membrane protein [Chitinophaga hostae]MBS0031121.1 SusC/RagA family TonB-linked outer membrane protein [Chitinophaga hostae]
MRKSFLFILLCMSGVSVYAQQVLKGTVKDAVSHQPVPGATVKVVGSAKGATTNEKGEFELNVPANAQLQISSVGFENVVVAANLIKAGPVMMQIRAINLVDAVVVGYGTQQKGKVTNAISTLKSGSLAPEKNIGSDFGKALTGRVAGVFVASKDGSPGNTPNILIRGAQSVNASSTNPLIVIDGLIVEGNTISINNINPQDIESIEVLKDAASAAIYGARGSTGVIIVTTKKGKLNSKPVFNLNMYTGVNNVPTSRHMLNTEQYTSAFMDARNNRIADINTQLANPDNLTPAKISQLNNERTTLQSQVNGLHMADRSTDWLDKIKNKNAPVSNIQASMSGGGDKNNYYMSLGRYSEAASIGTGNFERYTGRLDLTQQVADWLKVNGSINITQSVRKNISNPIVNAFNARPDTPEDPVLNPDGSLGYYVAQQQHPLGSMLDNNNKDKNNVYLGSLSADVKLLKELSFRSSFNATKFNGLTTTFSPASGYLGAFNKGIFKNQGTDNFSYNFDNYFTYIKKISRLGINATLGYTFYNNQLSYFGYDLNGFPKIDGITGGAAGSSYGSTFSIGSYNGNNKEISDAYFLRTGFDWEGKYMLNASIRRDGSSKLNADNRYSWFPSISGGWDIARENFLANSRLINQLKIRSSYGISGNIRPLGYFDAQNLLNATSYIGNPALMLGTLVGNPNIRWERTKQVDAGIDVTLLNNRLSFSADYYNKTTDGLMSNNDVSWIYGANSIPDNIGSIRNYGFDLELGISSRAGTALSWKVETNMNINRNMLLSLKDSLTNYGAFVFGGPMTKAKVGQSLGSVQVYESLGVDPQTGDMLYKDQNKDGKWDSNDLITVPVALPAFTGGTNITLSYKNFTIEALFNYVVGNKVYDFYEQTLRDYGTGYFGVMPNKFDVINQRWKQKGDITDVPRAITGVHGAGQTIDWNYRPSTQFVYDASYVRLRNLSVSYNIPASILGKAKISRARIYASAQNVFTMTKYIGFDPEAAANNGIVSSNMPNPRSAVVGIDLSF